MLIGASAGRGFERALGGPADSARGVLFGAWLESGVGTYDVHNPLQFRFYRVLPAHKPGVHILILLLQQSPITFFIGLRQARINILQKGEQD